MASGNPFRIDDPRWAEFESARAAWVLNDREQRRKIFPWAALETTEIEDEPSLREAWWLLVGLGVALILMGVFWLTGQVQ